MHTNANKTKQYKTKEPRSAWLCDAQSRKPWQEFQQGGKGETMETGRGCYVTSKMGEIVSVPEELIQPKG